MQFDLFAVIVNIEVFTEADRDGLLARLSVDWMFDDFLASRCWQLCVLRLWGSSSSSQRSMHPSQFISDVRYLSLLFTRGIGMSVVFFCGLVRSPAILLAHDTSIKIASECCTASPQSQGRRLSRTDVVFDDVTFQTYRHLLAATTCLLFIVKVYYFVIFLLVLRV